MTDFQILKRLYNDYTKKHLKKIILPALSENKIVICDRFVDSSIVYQGMVGGLDEEVILKVHDNFCYKKSR